MNHADILDPRTLFFLQKLERQSGDLHQPPQSEPPLIASLDEAAHYLASADMLMSLGQFRTAEIILLGVLSVCPSSQAAMLKLSELYEQEGFYAKTLSVAESVIASREGSENLEAHYQRAFSLFRLGRHDEALEAILPQYVSTHPPRVTRLCGLILKGLGQQSDAIEIFKIAIKTSPNDVYSIRALSELYAEVGMFQKGIDLLRAIPSDLRQDRDRLGEAIMLRLMGELELSIEANSAILSNESSSSDALWAQCFNFSTAGSKYSQELIRLGRAFWSIKIQEPLDQAPIVWSIPASSDKPLRIAFLTSDLGEHVVSRFMTPLLRHYDKSRYHITLLSTHRRFEKKVSDIVSLVDEARSLQELNLRETYKLIENLQPSILIETNGFTRHSGIEVLARRCAPVQCHYIGYHATTALSTMDYFIGDSITAPRDFQWQFTEKLVQMPELWMAYDCTLGFPAALSTTKRDCPIFGSFSQTAKINQLTLEYWAEAMNACPDSILVLKDRGLHCEATRKRIENNFNSLEVNPDRVYMFGAVASHLDHLDSYNAIDIALDTTPWSSATTAFEALGMGVPLIAICGDTTSSRMSTSVASAAGMKKLVAHSKEEFAAIAGNLAKSYKQIRRNKEFMQREIRSGVLFDEKRISRDFFALLDRLAAEHSVSRQTL